MGTFRKLTSTQAGSPSSPAVLFLHLPLDRVVFSQKLSGDGELEEQAKTGRGLSSWEA